jgi:hypothetical protein
MKDLSRFAKLLFGQWWFTAFAILSLISTASTFAPAFYAHFAVPRWIPVAVFGIAFVVACFRIHLRESHAHSAEVDALKREIAVLKVGPYDEHRRRAATILSVMTPGKTWRLAEIALLSKMTEEDALQALRVMKERDKVISIDVDEEPKGTFWRRV